MQSRVFPRLGFGCVSLTACKSLWHARKVLDQAAESGIHYFDTAPSYGKGYSEIILGKFLASNPTTRDRFWIASKLSTCLPSSPAVPVQLGMAINRIRRKAIDSRKTNNGSPRSRNYNPPLLTAFQIQRSDLEKSLERSLSSLKTTYLDVCLLHESLPSFLSESAVEFLKQQKKLGTIRNLGVAAHGSNYLSLSEDELKDWDVLQYEFGSAWPSHGQIIKQFPNKHHVVHSCLDKKNYDARLSSNKYPSSSLLLAEAARQVRNSTVLFSSLNLSHIRQNASEVNTAILKDGHS